MHPSRDPDFPIRVIRAFINESPENHLGNGTGEKAFDDPLVGFARGDDPLWEAYKEHVGPFHLTPLELFFKTFPETPARADELAVVSYVLPQMPATRKDNRREKRFPADRWARGRIFGEEVNVKLRRHVVETLAAEGIASVAPLLSPLFAKTDGPYGYSSTWSERHAAHAAGLGTFGLCDGLITARGKAHRVGSVIAKAHWPATPRPYTDHHAYCLFYTRGVCGVCIDRCPAGALSENGHDKVKCREHVHGAAGEHVRNNYGFEGFGCGLCQTLVPCESRIPEPRAARP